MESQAKVTSIDALENFRANLMIFMTKAHQTLDVVGDEIRRTRSWIQHDRRIYWEAEVRKRARVLAQAEQELLSARMIKLLENLAARQAAVRKAKQALQEAEMKLRNVKRWSRDFEGAMEPLAKSLQTLREYLTLELPRGVSFLLQAQKTLEAYGEIRPVAEKPPSDSTNPAA
jgi:DNA repair exonuclease SbcCD ATPase subunit